MSILLRVKISPQQRFDLEDFLAQQSSDRSDSKLFIQKFFSDTNVVVGGLSVSGIGFNSATVNMTNAALIIPQNTFDFSYFVSAPSEPAVTISDADLVDGVRNYVELELTTLDGVPLTKAFWDPEANAGSGLEFNQIVNTITDLRVSFVVSTGGFSGSPDRIPICIIDTNGSGVIVGILDRRALLFRLGQPGSPHANYSWTSQVEPPVSLTLSGVSGSYTVGETVTFTSGASATVVTGGGGPVITVKLLSSPGIAAGDTVTGGSSAATGTLVSFLDSFTGADKSVNNIKNSLAAIMTEIKAIKGTPEWFNVAPASLSDGSSSEDRSGYLRSDNTILWTGSQIQFTTDIILELVDTVIGSVTQHKILVANSPISLANLESLWVSIDRSQTSENLTIHQTSIDAIPSVNTNRNVFVIARRVDVSSVHYLHLPFMKSLMLPGQSVRLGQSGTGSGIQKVTFHDPVSTVLPTGASVTIDGVSGANGDLVLYSNLISGNNEVYLLGGVGSSITWTAQNFFSGLATPTTGDLVIATSGAAFSNSIGEFNGTNWKFNDVVRYFNGADYWEQGSLKTSSLLNNTTGNIFSVTALGSENIIVDFSILRGAVKETGTLWLTNDGTNAFFTAGGTFSAASGLSFTADINAGNVRLRYTLDNSGSDATFKYSIKRWSDAAGGPTGVPSYSPFIGAAPNSAFVMSDNSGTPINCSNAVVLGKTQITLSGFTYTTGLNSGTTVGQLEVYVNGQHYPRFVAGSTLDGYYKEISSSVIEFNADLSVSALSIEIIKRNS